MYWWQGKGHWQQVRIQKTRLDIPKVKVMTAWQKTRVSSRTTTEPPKHCSHWSSSYTTALSLVESFIVMLQGVASMHRNNLLKALVPGSHLFFSLMPSLKVP